MDGDWRPCQPPCIWRKKNYRPIYEHSFMNGSKPLAPYQKRMMQAKVSGHYEKKKIQQFLSKRKPRLFTIHGKTTPSEFSLLSGLLSYLKRCFFSAGFFFHKIDKGAGSFHIHRKTMKELGALAVLGIRERPNLAQNLVTHRH